MTEEPKNSAELVGHVLDATQKLAKSRSRRTTVLIVVLLIVISGLGVNTGVQIASGHSKTSTISQQQTTIQNLQTKSAEQTIAEVELRDDVNKLSELNKSLTADHSIALSVYCSIAVTVHDVLPAVAANCPKGTP